MGEITWSPHLLALGLSPGGMADLVRDEQQNETSPAGSPQSLTPSLGAHMTGRLSTDQDSASCPDHSGPGVRDSQIPNPGQEWGGGW